MQSQDMAELMERNPKIFFWYILNAVGKPGAMVNAQMAFDVAPTGKTGDGAVYLNQVIPETIRQLTVSDIEEYKVHRGLRKAAGYDYDDVINFFSAKYPPPKIVSNADDPKFRLDGGELDTGDAGARPATGDESQPIAVLPAPSLPGNGHDG